MGDISEMEDTENDEIASRNNLRRNSIYLLPNAITLAALLSAFFAITQAMSGRYEHAAVWIFVSMICDGIDGRVARMTKTQSSFGEQLDSLSDMVSFGVAPSLVVYVWQLKSFGRIGYSVAFIYCACAALRLALFNTLIGKMDKRWFIGIPSPTAAALIAGLVWVHHGYERLPHIDLIALFITLFAGLSMVVQIKFWSFKEIGMGRTVPFFAMIIIVLLLLLLSWQPSLILFSFFMLYSLSGYVVWLWQFLHRKKSNPVETKT